MRLLRISTWYPLYLRQFYDRQPGLTLEPYAEQHARLMADCFGLADFWARALRAEVGYEAEEIIANVESMQKAWANEQGQSYTEEDWLFEITTAQIKAFKPDVLFVNDYITFTASYLRELKSECPSIRLVLGWCGGPYPDLSVFREYDVVLSCIPELVCGFREAGLRSHHLNHAFAPHILENLDMSAPPNVDFAFIGSITKQTSFHEQREQLLLQLVQKTDLQFWSAINQPSFRRRSGAMVRRAAFDTVDLAQRVGVPGALLKGTPLVQKVARWPTRPPVPGSIHKQIVRRARPPIFGVEMYQQLRQSKISLNTHIDISPVSASNQRLFEATGVGATCLLTDWKANLKDLFEPDVEVTSYKSAEECVEKVRYLLDHEDERRKIAAAGQRRTLRDHTFAQRAAQLDLIIKDYFS